MQELMDTVPWRADTIRLFGRTTYRQPRLMCWMADDGCQYRYSGRPQVIEPSHPQVDRLRDRLSLQEGHRFNSALLNLYRDGNDTIKVGTLMLMMNPNSTPMY